YRTATQLLDALHAHALVENAAVDHADSLDAAAAAKELGIARRGNEEGAEARLQDGALGHEAVVRRGVQVEAAEADSDADGEACLGRQRRPADIAAAVPPVDPRRRPDVARHPAPAQRSVLVPAAVVEGRPAPGLIGRPGPPVVGVDPVARGVRTPAGRDPRSPDLAVARVRLPTAEGREPLVEVPGTGITLPVAVPAVVDPGIAPAVA